ncbi:MAG TPA: hypothetical protein V6D07_18735 [Trichocoleus sp.]
MPYFVADENGSPEFSQGFLLNHNPDSGHVIEASEEDYEDWKAQQAQGTPPSPRLQEMVARFTYPGNPLYASIAGKVAVSNWMAQDHFANLKTLLMTRNDPDALAAGINYLATLVEQAGHPFQAEEINSWNALVAEFDLPESCRLPSPSN